MSEATRYSKYEPLFGFWHIKKKIGQGAIGQVYEIERTEPGVTYSAALKAITIPDGPEEIKRVLSSGVAKEDLPDYYRSLIDNITSEFRYLARLKGNSYIVNYEDHLIVEDEEELRWDILIKTELLTPLVEHVEKEELSEHDVLRLGIDICRALRYCARYNILHRDIKPENIFIAPSGDYKLGDFGIARVVEQTQMDLSRKGTYTYMAPEVFHGRKYDQAADLYSLGLVMYKYLNNGRTPFMPPYPQKISYEDPEKAFTERMSGRDLPEPATGSARLRRVVLKACSYRPEDRYNNAEEMLTDLEEIYLSEKKKDRRAEKKKQKPAKKSVKAAPAAVSKSRDTAAMETGNAETAEKSGSMKAPNKKRWIAAGLCALLAAAGAGVYAAIPKEVTDITGINDEVQLYYDGELSPEYAVEPEWFKDEPISFSSENEDVFTVSEDGIIKAVSIGEADMTMKAKEYEEHSHIRIVPKVTAIKGVEESYSLYTGDSFKLEPQLQPKEFRDEPVAYSSSDENVAGVAKDGTVTAAAPGETKLTISAGGSSISTTVYVSDPPVSKPAAKTTKTSKKTTKKTSKKTSKKKSSGSSEGYFGDTEYFSP